MRKTHRVVVNGQEFAASRGDILLDAALMNGVHIPHDCRSGHCGTCSVHVVAGELFGGGDGRDVKACQCRIIADVEVAVEDVPDVATVSGRVAAVTPLSPDVVSVCIAPQRPVEYLPGQYLQVQFRGFASRCYSPTVPLDRSDDRHSIHLHVRRVRNGRVSSALGTSIKAGHRVKLQGPFGSAYLRPALVNRLVLIASGTGFAPIWSIADAAMRENSARELVLVVGARSIESLYMIPALWRLAGCPNTTIIPVIGDPRMTTRGFQIGSPTDHLPALVADDIVYAAGAPQMVDVVKQMAEASGATWYADPFVPNSDGRQGLLSRMVTRLLGDVQLASLSLASPSMVPSQSDREPDRHPDRRPDRPRLDIVRAIAAANAPDADVVEPMRMPRP
jgi:NAD(P)H-flavin reductase/ferredoxin